MPVVFNPVRGEMVFTDNPEALYAQGYRDPTQDELAADLRREEFGTFGQQAQAQAERVVRGATLGAVEGFGGDPEAIRARAEVSQELSPVTSFAASVAPDLGVAALTGGLGGLATGAGRAAGRAALAEGAGLVRAGLATARAGGAAALAAESVGTGLVGAGQEAYGSDREFADNPGQFAEDALIWGGLNFGLGAFAMRAAGRAVKAGAEATEAAGESVDDIAKAAEFKASKGISADSTPGTPGQIFDVEGSSPPAKAPLDDVELLGPDGMMDTAAPDDPRLGAISAELDQLRQQGIAGLSLKDLRALPLEEGTAEGVAQSAAKVDAFAQDEAFLREGMLPSNNDRGRGGLPVLTFYGDNAPSLGNGRHRLTAARRAGKDEIIMNVQRFDAEGNPVWDYVGPVRVSAEKVPEAAVRQGEREAVEGGVERALRRSSESDAEDLVDEVIGKAPVAEADSFARQRRLYINRKAIQEVSAREMGEDLSKLVKDVGDVTRREKLATIAKDVGDNLPAQRAVANGIAQQAAKFAGELRAEARAYGAASGKKSLQYAIPGQKGLTLALMDHAKEIEKATSGKALFEALDNFKRTAQDYKLSLETGALNSANPIHHQQLIPRIDAFASNVRTALEDSKTWGKAGDMQRAYNAVISDRLMPSWRIFEETTMQRTHKGYDGMWNLEGWETKIASLLKNTDPGARRHVGTVLDAMDELAGVRRQFGDAKMAARIESQVSKVRRTLGLADEVADATERMGALGQLVGGVPMGGAIAGGIAGGLPGAAIGAALPGAVRGLVMGDLVSAYQRLSGATEEAAARGVDDWIRSSKVRGTGVTRRIADRLPKLSGEAKQVAEVAARRGVSQGLALFMGEDKTPGAAFERLRDKLIDEDGFYQSIDDEYGTLRETAPEAFMALAGRASLARQFLLERMPPNVAVSVANPDGYPPNREAIEDWATYVNAVRYPARVAKNIASAQVQEIETLRTVHPRMHETLQAKTLEGIQRAQQSGDPLDDNFLMRVAILFPDVDGVGSPVFSREYGKTVREYNAMQREKGGGGQGSPKPKTGASPLNTTAQNGPTFGSGF